ncbi:Asp23/Gls24 family envelope stress response protein [Nonomuraea turkmeniaca]|uniref:Asp23/Gls24 family envelope stress response protein n=1 Tax=Nonomuraea turkmeniaca TaxID=103838 RepID=A0A5S4FUW9_9ACTN|nr:Asp23/Gls24 family envelope stress response protein [Nonomuraea turkmeniaca]TMR24567.1 Asp23/Gls24 family envelope stress response protein [Nonomuraea turkmeniaca]
MSEALAEHAVPPAEVENPESSEHSENSENSAEPADGPALGQSTPYPSGAMVKGRIKVADEVVEKVAALAALEVAGVADMGGDLARAFESVRDRIGIGSRRGTQGVNAQIQDRQVAVDLTIVVEYGHVVMEVASEVKMNVARSVSRMLGMRVMEVNVTVDDVRLPGEGRPTSSEEPPDDALAPFAT